MTPVAAKRSILRSGYFVSPANRSARWYSTPVWFIPIQLNMPRTKRLDSRIWLNTSSARAVDEAEVADVERHLDLGDLVEAAVEPGGGRPLEPRLAVALLADRVDDVVALAPARGELEHDLGRVLQVGVEHDHRVARGQVDAGGQRDLVAEVPRELASLNRGSCWAAANSSS